MDLGLWDPPHNQVSEESHDNFQNGWHPDFHSGHALDVIEEEALNEKYCLQVLRILVAKADAEIIELEDDVLILQTQLALANAEWAEVCFAALRERMDSLEILIRSLKDVQDKHDPEVRSQLHREPAQKLHVILKDLLCNNFQPKAEQPAKAFVGSPSLLAAAVSRKTDLGKYNSEERKTLDTKEDFESQDEDARNPFAKPQVKIRKISDADLTSNAEKLGTEQRKEERKLNNLTLGLSCTIALAPEKHGRPMSSNPGKKADVVEKHKNDDSIISDTAKNVLAEASAKSSEKDLRKIDSKDKQNTEKQSPTPKKPGNRPNPPMIDENEQPAIAFGKDTTVYTLGDEIAFRQKGWKNIDSEVGSVEEVREQSFTDDSIISNTRSNPVPIDKKSADIVKVAGAVLDSKSNAAKHLVEVSNLKQEPRRALEAAEAKHISTKKLALTPKMNTKSDQRINGEEQGLHDSKLIFSDSLSELLKYRRKDASKPQIKVKQKSQARYILKPEACRTDKCSSNLSLKRKCQPDQEPCLAEELGLKLASLGKSKKQRNPGIGGKSSSDRNDNKNINKENQQDLGWSKMSDAAPDAIVTSVPQRPKGRKISANSPVIKVNEDIRNFRKESANMHDDTTKPTIEKGLRIVNYSSKDDSDDEIPKLPPCLTSLHCDLDRMPVVQLRAIAKEQNLKRYSKLRKADLLKLLGLKLQESN